MRFKTFNIISVYRNCQFDAIVRVNWAGGLLLWNSFDQSIEKFSNRKQPTRTRSGSCETDCIRGISQRQTVIWLNVCFESAQEKTNSKQIIYNTLLAGAKSAREWEKEGTSAGAPGQERTTHGLSPLGRRCPHSWRSSAALSRVLLRAVLCSVGFIRLRWLDAFTTTTFGCSPCVWQKLRATSALCVFVY